MVEGIKWKLGMEDNRDFKNRSRSRKVIFTLCLLACFVFIFWAFFSLSNGKLDENIAVVIFLAVVIFVIYIVSLVGKPGK